ncbi:flagellar protein FliT [Ectothiorhodospira lacustris]|uniref:flagellar protein FliT n=1 Tax=Ectothiorhodospira lacustris TaxID=2899127 RepID=UPI001EE92274|nr:flagellar protein FliT [Ectothiorhodospira lacustris]MCG5500488.1 flagellar protein FliT [Ectothiorhodospira lacustris]
MASTHLDEIMATAKALEALSQRNLELAQAGDWEALIPLESEREALVAQLKLERLSAEDVEQDAVMEVLSARLTRIQSMDEALVSLVTQARDALGQELRQVKKGVAGARLYEDVRQGQG